MPTKLKRPFTRLGTSGLRRRRFLVPAFPDLTWIFVLTHALLFALLSVYLLCGLMSGGFSAHFWLEPHRFGLSLYQIVSAVDVLLLLTLIVGIVFVPLRRAGRVDRARVATFAFALLLLAGTHTLVECWRRFASDDLRQTLAAQTDGEVQLRAIQSELAELGEHPWAGEYVPTDWQRSGTIEHAIHYWFAPNSGGVVSWKPGFPDVHESLRAIPIQCRAFSITSVGTGITGSIALGPTGEPLFPMQRGEKRYLAARGETHFTLERCPSSRVGTCQPR